ncbi:MAG: DUF424 domain-containing protein [Methanomicrobiales archaeon]|nr:DUF424 domain-containing protein [Methanomicrobiales archaeon]
MNGTMFLKVHHTRTAGDIVAVCDRELLNTTLEWKGLRMEITEAFYGNQLATGDEVRQAMREAACINLMGKRALSCARELELVDEQGCIMIGDVPHAQIYSL